MSRPSKKYYLVLRRLRRDINLLEDIILDQETEIERVALVRMSEDLKTRPPNQAFHGAFRKNR